MGQKGLQTPCEIRTGKEERLLQRICPASDRRAVRHEASLLQFRDRDRIVQGFPCQVRKCRREEGPDGDGQCALAQEGEASHMGRAESRVCRHKGEDGGAEPSSLLAGPQSDRAGLEKNRRGGTHNRYFKDISEFENALTSYFDGFGKPNPMYV